MLPSRLLAVRQDFPNLGLADVRAAARAGLEECGLAARLEPGARVAIGVGSRGIANIDVIVHSVVEYWRDHGRDHGLRDRQSSRGRPARPDG